VRPVHGGCKAALAAVVLVCTVLVCTVWAAPAGAETTVVVEAGYAGSFVAGHEVPVRVRVAADRLVQGTLEVGVGNPGNELPVAMAVEVPGGSQKEFVVTAPSGFTEAADVAVRLLQGDQVVASGQATVRATVDTELVGILPGALRGRPVPGQAPLAVDAGTARFVALREADLDQAPASLGPLSTLVADADELAQLAPGARAGVLRWVEAGGRLLVDAAKGQAVPGLPDQWQPGPRGRAAAGLGEVVATDGAVAAGRWPGLVEPSGWATQSARFGGDVPVATSLAADAGLRTPEIAWLVGFLVVYVVLVGPVAFFVLRRRGRPELAWVAIPLVAIVFSTGSWAVGRNLRDATELVHASVVSTGGAGPVATSYVGVFSRSGETARIGFPPGWSSGASSAGPAATPTIVTRTAAGPEARLALNAGQFGMAAASGPIEGGGLEVRAAVLAGGRVSGTVRNATAFRLLQVAAFAGSDAAAVGELAPGEERAFEIANGQARFDGGNPEFRVWGGLGMGTPESTTDLGLWHTAVRDGGVNFLSPDAVVAAGWTRDFVPELRAGGRRASPGGRTLVVGRGAATLPAAGPAEATARRDIVRDPFAQRAFRGFAGGGSVVRFVFPDGAATSGLTIPNVFGAAEFWQDGAWQQAACEGAGCVVGANAGCPPGVPCRIGPAPFDAQLALPAAAVANGVAYVRVPGPASIDQPLPFTISRSA
jgi:hypothetical protein